MKLAEIFSELYDNEWTAAFMELEGDKYEEKQIIVETLESNIAEWVHLGLFMNATDPPVVINV
ncbi:hypothetical protein MAR_023545 [Mya arenaria]|uniref:Uncharacterized protein n=1 Tax=Mya arenaria TaxID=6604 RepID=A0ABY7DNA4_MYAAR|nr:hypothetical protein MAR_023545 [Mya arenaria]